MFCCKYQICQCSRAFVQICRTKKAVVKCFFITCLCSSTIDIYYRPCHSSCQTKANQVEMDNPGHYNQNPFQKNISGLLWYRLQLEGRCVWGVIQGVLLLLRGQEGCQEGPFTNILQLYHKYITNISQIYQIYRGAGKQEHPSFW